MTGWWLRVCRAVWTRWNEWRHWAHLRKEDRQWRADNRDRLSMWWTEPRMPAIEDTGSIVATPEDLAEIGPFDPVTRVPRQGRGQHRKGES